MNPDGPEALEALLGEGFGPFGFPEFVDRDGMPITMERWTQRFEDPNYKRVALTHLRGLRVSTVWLGMDHGLDDRGMYFETMIFNQSRRHCHRPWADRYMERYETELEARRGHQRLVDRLRQRGVTALGTWTQRKKDQAAEDALLVLGWEECLVA